MASRRYLFSLSLKASSAFLRSVISRIVIRCAFSPSHSVSTTYISPTPVSFPGRTMSISVDSPFTIARPKSFPTKLSSLRLKTFSAVGFIYSIFPSTSVTIIASGLQRTILRNLSSDSFKACRYFLSWSALLVCFFIYFLTSLVIGNVSNWS